MKWKVKLLGSSSSSAEIWLCKYISGLNDLCYTLIDSLKNEIIIFGIPENRRSEFCNF